MSKLIKIENKHDNEYGNKYPDKYHDKHDDKSYNRYNDKHDDKGYNKYHDMINLPSPKSRKHPPMSLSNRAAQFAPFSALTGHKEIIKETARRTGEKVELEEDAIRRLNEKIMMIQENFPNRSEIIITYFLPDDKKEGGSYITERRNVKRVDPAYGQLLMKDGACIPLEDIFQIELLLN